MVASLASNLACLSEFSVADLTVHASGRGGSACGGCFMILIVDQLGGVVTYRGNMSTHVITGKQEL
ncbi:hypothetical protein QJS10_CPA02g00861 [Acorus calamus]|uniref:Uncharacterized protein n=1 Tax=Acorus calamus TaxID=4465 RepID=A0AAV9FFG1_ACOCL|nr:hypothetical protein QJS10_CPA02g00861 [Acorus calamus]